MAALLNTSAVSSTKTESGNASSAGKRLNGDAQSLERAHISSVLRKHAFIARRAYIHGPQPIDNGL